MTASSKTPVWDRYDLMEAAHAVADAEKNYLITQTTLASLRANRASFDSLLRGLADELDAHAKKCRAMAVLLEASRKERNK